MLLLALGLVTETMNSQQPWFSGASYRLSDDVGGRTEDCAYRLTDVVFIAVPADIAPKILHEGYRCSRRRWVPANRDAFAAIRAYRRVKNHRTRPAALLKVVCLPSWVATMDHKDGVKLEIGHLPASCLVRVDHTPAIGDHINNGEEGAACVPPWEDSFRCECGH